MKIPHTKILEFIIALPIIFNVLCLAGPFLSVPRAIIAFAFLLFCPGYLILSLIPKKREFYESVLLSAGLSISFIMLGGLALNWLLPFAGVTNPLSLFPVIYFFEILIIGLCWASFMRNKGITHDINLTGPGFKQSLLYIIAIIFPFWAVISSLLLNNGGSSIVPALLLGAMGGYALYLVLNIKRLDKRILPFALVSIGLTLLLMTSMRGWYITGHDMMDEYRVFGITELKQHWDPMNIDHGYNACLSLTILPTVLQIFTGMNDMYVYKILFQVIFAFVGLAVYLIFTRFAPDNIAFLASLFFIAQPVFTVDMPMLNRQEIALLLFSIYIYVVIQKNIDRISRWVLLGLTGFGVVVSHYTTSYLMIAVLGGSLAVFWILKWITHLRKGMFADIDKQTMNISLFSVVLLLFFTFAWYSQVADMSAKVGDLVVNSITHMQDMFQEEMKANTVSTLFSPKSADLDKAYGQFVDDTVDKYITQSGAQTFYIPQDQSSIQFEETQKMDPTLVSGLLHSANISPYKFVMGLKIWVARIAVLFLFIGVGFILFARGERAYNLQFISLAIVSTIIMALLVILPFLSLEYGATRLFQQMLVVLSLPAVIGIVMIVDKLKDGMGIKVAVVFIVFYFVLFTGFLPIIVGEVDGQLHFSNKGNYYGSNYLHASEFDAIAYFKTIYDSKTPVYGDNSIYRKFLGFTNIETRKIVMPRSLTKNSYVITGYSNINEGVAYGHVLDTPMAYAYPLDFLNEHKNLIYSNAESAIYR